MTKFRNSYLGPAIAAVYLVIIAAVNLGQCTGQPEYMENDGLLTLVVHNVDDALLRNRGTNAVISRFLQQLGENLFETDLKLRFVVFKDYMEDRTDAYMNANHLSELLGGSNPPVSAPPTSKVDFSIRSLFRIFFESVLYYPYNTHSFVIITNDIAPKPALTEYFEDCLWEVLLDPNISDEQRDLFIRRFEQGSVIAPLLLAVNPILPNRVEVSSVIHAPFMEVIDRNVPSEALSPRLLPLRIALNSFIEARKTLKFDENFKKMQALEKRAQNNRLESENVEKHHIPDKMENKLESENDDEGRQDNTILFVAIGSVAGVILLISIILLCVFKFKKLKPDVTVIDPAISFIAKENRTSLRNETFVPFDESNFVEQI